MTSIRADHPLIGTWIASDEDSDAAFVVSAADNRLQVSGFCRSDSEQFEITDVNWDGEKLSFVARMPSTNAVTKNVFHIRPDGMAELELTIYELWKKKPIVRGELPEAWRDRAKPPGESN